MYDRRGPLAVLIALACVCQGWGADEKAARKELAKLQGTWKVVSVTTAIGNEIGSDALENLRMTIKDSTFTVTQGAQVVAEGTFKVIEVEGKRRKTDATYTAPEDLRDKVLPQLAEWVDADTFRVAVPTVQNLERPKEVEAGEGRALAVFKRVKE